MKSQRQLQIGERIKRIIADIFLRENLLTIDGSYITSLEADARPDIKNVRIFIDIFGNEENAQKILQKLNEKAPHFRYELGKQLTSRNTPEIRFILDETQKNALNLEALIEEEGKFFSPLKKPRKKK